MSLSKEKPILIIGAGICGLATALALHRKGLRSIILERSESLRAAGGAIAIHANGWRALDQLGVGQMLRSKAIRLETVRDVSPQGETVTILNGELRVLQRSDIIYTLANNLPPDTIRFGCQIHALNLDPQTAHPIVHVHDGTSIQAKVVIGCDGMNSVVADWLGLKTPRHFAQCAVRGSTNYPNGHGFGNEFSQIRINDTLLGKLPVDDKLVCWFVDRRWKPEDSMLSKDPKLIRDSAVDSVKDDFSADGIEMIRNSDLKSLTLLRTSYRPPWDLLMGNFSRGTVTVAGDAMHLMGPFLGQGGSAGLEDAVVLARCLATAMSIAGHTPTSNSELQEKVIQKRIGMAFDQYVKERRMRLLGLSAQTYLIGMFRKAQLSVMKLMFVMLLKILFPNRFGHTRHDCGRL